jgi:hypothetical protein
MPYGQNPLIQLALEDISRGTYRLAGHKKPVSGTSIVNKFAKQQDKDIKSRKKFNQSLRQSRALEGLLNPIVTSRKVDLSVGRNLEGLLASGQRPALKTGASYGLRNQGFGGALTGIMQGVGDQRWMLNTRQKAEENQQMLKGIFNYAKQDPSTFARMAAFSSLAPFANLAAEATGNNDFYDFIKEHPEVLKIMSPILAPTKGEIKASESMFTDYATPEDVVMAGLTFTPGTAFKAAKGAVTTGRLMAGLVRSSAAKYPRAATAAGAAGGAAALTLSDPDEADALSGVNAFRFIKEGVSPLARAVGETANAKARKTLTRIYGSLEAAKRAGAYESIPDIIYLEKITEAITKNPKYAEKVKNSNNNNDFQVLHTPGSALGRGKYAEKVKAVHTRDSIVYGSKKLNDMDEAMQRQGLSAENWRQVIEWGIKNDPMLKNKTLREAAEELGALHLI